MLSLDLADYVMSSEGDGGPLQNKPDGATSSRSIGEREFMQVLDEVLQSVAGLESPRVGENEPRVVEMAPSFPAEVEPKDVQLDSALVAVDDSSMLDVSQGVQEEKTVVEELAQEQEQKPMDADFHVQGFDTLIMQSDEGEGLNLDNLENFPSTPPMASASVNTPESPTTGSVDDRTCKVCGKRVRYPYLLKIHNIAHTDLKQHQCQYCDFRCKWRSSMTYHVNKFHNPSRSEKGSALKMNPP
ncbi:hypothetical protein NDN08_002927 [Rhodosorus marinus]|uniref:C2H2-type domain-containing protein n=1 Tax=Rhodosorus marinus TaxID=101924 RepID=A0AAV8UVB1_9RHOD|nr:hypothetical protein NDN08_002927 [Rhodosorus marinus]